MTFALMRRGSPVTIESNARAALALMIEPGKQKTTAGSPETSSRCFLKHEKATCELGLNACERQQTKCLRSTASMHSARLVSRFPAHARHEPSIVVFRLPRQTVAERACQICLAERVKTTYRRANAFSRLQVWHFCRNCDDWPHAYFEELTLHTSPPGTFCFKCLKLRRAGRRSR